MSEPAYVQVELADGPVIIAGHDGGRLSNSYALWNGIIAEEHFPADGGKGANYVISLKKKVMDAKGVRPVEDE